MRFVKHWQSDDRYYYQLLSPEETTISIYGWEKAILEEHAAELGVDFEPVPSAIAINDLEPGAKIVLLWDFDIGDCVFLDEESQCMVWGNHPLRCKSYPLRSLELVVDHDGAGLLKPAERYDIGEGDSVDPECCFCREHPDETVMVDVDEKLAYVRHKEFEQYLHLFLKLWESNHNDRFRLVRNESRRTVLARHFIRTVDILDYGIERGLVSEETVDQLLELTRLDIDGVSGIDLQSA